MWGCLVLLFFAGLGALWSGDWFTGLGMMGATALIFWGIISMGNLPKK